MPGGLQVPGGQTSAGPGAGWGAAGAGRALAERSGESVPWTARPVTRACRFGARPQGWWWRNPSSPRPRLGRSSAPDPSPSPLPASCGLVALGPRGALRVAGSSGRDCSPRSPGIFGPRTPRLTPPPPPCAPPPPRTPCAAPHGAHPRLGWMRGGESGGFRELGSLEWQVCSPDPEVALPPTLSHPPAPGTSPSLAVPPRGHLGQRAPRCETPLQRRVSWTWGQSSVCGGRRVAFPGEKALLGVGPGVRHVQTCCWGAAHLILEVAGTGGWKGTDIYDQSHLGTESGPGCRWLSGFQAITEDVPRGAQMAGDEAAELCALAQRSTHALVPAQLYLFSPLTFLLRALGAASSPTLPRRWP